MAATWEIKSSTFFLNIYARFCWPGRACQLNQSAALQFDQNSITNFVIMAVFIDLGALPELVLVNRPAIGLISFEQSAALADVDVLRSSLASSVELPQISPL
ncbi:MAG: hypothetical protein WBP93_07785 [Pyrinomonadaceae bacterium]